MGTPDVEAEQIHVHPEPECAVEDIEDDGLQGGVEEYVDA
jgi:hypothetical protein